MNLFYFIETSISILESFVLSPEGNLQSRETKEVKLFLLMFYCFRKRILDARGAFCNASRFVFCMGAAVGRFFLT